MDFPLTLTHILGRAETYFGRGEIVTRLPDRSFHRTSYGETLRRARQLAVALRQLGLERGDRVATLCWNHHQHHEAYFGVPCGGFVLHTLNLRLHQNDLAYIASHAGDRGVIVDRALLPLLEQFRAETPIEHVWVVEDSYEELLATMEHEHVTWAAGVPTIWMGILARLDAEPGRWDLSAMKAMLVGGSAVPRAMIAAFEGRHGLRICQGWGMTETSPVASTVALPYDLAEADAETRWDYQAMVGVPLPFVEIRVRAGDEDVPWDGESMGELEVRGPWVAASYYDAPETADRWSDDGWFRTGDIVSIHPR